MIFGFNSDIRHGEAVYHVQSEVRQREQLLQTQVFVGGRCLGKRAVPIPATLPLETSEQHLHDLLKAQHREIVEIIRAGNVDSLLAPMPARGLSVQCSEAQAIPVENLVRLRFRVNLAEAPVADASVIGRLDAPGHGPLLMDTTTAADGAFELHFPLDQAKLGEGVLSLQVTHASSTLRSRFRLRKN